MFIRYFSELVPKFKICAFSNMSGAREFRLTLHLHYFYKDHRALSKIFVTDDMKTIRNLKRKIKDMFGVKRFCLMSHSCYLPDEEDVRVLQTDDVVVAVPKSMLPSKEVVLPPPQPPGLTLPVAQEASTKKSKRSLEESGVVEVVRKVKKKKTKLSTDSPFLPPAKSSPKDSAVEESDAKNSSLHTDTSSAKKIKQKIDYFETLDKGNDTSCVSMNSVREENTPKSRKVFQPVTKLEKVVNVVRNIVVSGPALNDDNSEVQDKSDNITGMATLDEDSNFVTKRRRRTRKRHKKSNSSAAEASVVEVPYRPPNVEVKNNCHIRFDVVEDGKVPAVVVCDMDMTLESSVEKVEEKEIILPAEKALPVVKEKTMSAENVESSAYGSLLAVTDKTMPGEKRLSVFDNIMKAAAKECSVVGTEVLTSPISEKLIASCPRMDIFKPRKDDIVIFKILKMGTGYCPQISEAITGKVKSYDADTDNVDFIILDGQSEFSEPEGKFSMEAEDDTPQLKCGTQKLLEWKTLIEPRLLYP